jgi:hypothetical protein
MQLPELAILAVATWLVYWLLGRLFPSELHATADRQAARPQGVVRRVSGWLS